MNFSIDFENERLSLVDHVASNVARKADAKRLVVALTPILEQKNRADAENERLKAETLRTLGDHGRTPTVDDLINLTNRSADGKAAFKRCMRANERRMQREIDRVEIHHYLNQTLNSGLDPSDPDEKRAFYLKLAVRAIDAQWSRANDSVVRDRDRHLARTRQYDRVKRSFSLFVDHVDDRLRWYADRVNAERSNTERPLRELEERMLVYEDAENKVLKLLKRMAVPEGCYMVLTWLSPAEWKQELGVGELSYDFARSDSDLTESNQNDYMNHAYQKPVDAFSRDVRSATALHMYWTSVEQLSKRLATLDEKTRNTMLMLDMTSDGAAAGSATKQQRDRHAKHAARAKLKHKLVSKKNYIDEIIAGHGVWDADGATADPLCVRATTHGRTMFRIKSILVDVYTALNHPYGDFSRPYRMVTLLCDRLYRALDECAAVPADLWRRIDGVLGLTERRAAKRSEAMRRKHAAVTTARREAERMYEEPEPGARPQKLLPYRVHVPRQRPPAAPRKPRLDGRQLRYLRCFTFLSPEDVSDDDIAAVPRLGAE